MVAVFNLYVFKCLQDVHVNFMNPSVFVTQPSAKEKIDFPNEIDTQRLSSCPYLVGWTATGATGRVSQILDCLSLKGSNLSVNSVCPASIYYPSLRILRGSQVAQWWKVLLPMQETQLTQVWSLGWEDPLEEEMATCSTILAWKIPWTKEPGTLQSMRSQRVRHNWEHTHTPTLGSTSWGFCHFDLQAGMQRVST